MTKRKGRTDAGKYYGRHADGALEEVPPCDPDFIVCRRVADYPNLTPPPGAAFGDCVRCGIKIAFNPAKYPDKPHICMQCHGIEPLPFPTVN